MPRCILVVELDRVHFLGETCSPLKLKAGVMAEAVKKLPIVEFVSRCIARPKLRSGMLPGTYRKPAVL
jgi:hypothetical protein